MHLPTYSNHTTPLNFAAGRSFEGIRIKKTNVGIIEGLEMLFDIYSSHMPEDNNFFSFN